jgi:hypothetical protein
MMTALGGGLSLDLVAGEVQRRHVQRGRQASGAQAQGKTGVPAMNRMELLWQWGDVDLLFQHYGVLASRLGAAGVAPTTTMLGVTRLAVPVLMVQLEGIAVA